ncbi:MAG TPA: molecular chaperone DnaJ [Ramlibacter sp.]|nr:molecular chaperone DnaJ [Ramlibacter sp.]
MAYIMVTSQQLQIRPAAGGAPLTPEQKRFNTLLRQIEQARSALQAWQAAIPQFRTSYQQLLAPLHEQLRAAQRDWAFALDAAGGRGWSRADHETRSDVLSEVARALLSGQSEDPELRALFARHEGMDFEEAEREQLQAFKGMAEAMTGAELGDDEDIVSEEELFEKLGEHFRREEDAAEARRAKAPPKRKSAAQQRREAEAQRATQSMREVYRKLASALHPDREPDPAERKAKTALMAQVNEAYDRGDLLALLELQLRIEQVDAEHLARADTQRLKHYNKVLAEQLEELRMEIDVVETGFQMDFGIDAFERLDPKRLGKLLESEAAQLRAALATVRRETRAFVDPAATRRWLKAQRRAQRDEDLDFF